MKTLTIAAAALMLATPALAQESGTDAEMMAPSGDAAVGETAFNRQCTSCHVVKDGDGETLAGRNARTGPNLYGMAGRQIGAEDGFRYSKSLKELGETGAVWDEAAFTGYVQDPTGWLRDTLDDKKARGKMSFKVRKEQDAHDIFAFLHAVSQPPE